MIHTSKKTARKQVPAIYRLVAKRFGWKRGSVNLDIGGGPWDLMTDKLDADGVINLIYDPYNRDMTHNDSALSEVTSRRVQTVTISNVLNVIRDLDDRKAVLEMAHAVEADHVYVTVYPGENTGLGRETRDGWQENRKVATYLDEVAAVFPHVEIKGKLLVARA